MTERQTELLRDRQTDIQNNLQTNLHTEYLTGRHVLTFFSPVSVAFYVAALLGFIEEHGLAQDIRVVIGSRIRATSCKVGFGIYGIIKVLTNI